MSKLFSKFSVYDLIVMAIMAAIGVAVKPIVVPLAHTISGPLMMPGGALAGGLYMLWLVLGYGIVGKPGTGTIMAVIQSLLVLLTGVVGSHGIMSLFTYTMPGICMDIVLLIIGHRCCCRGCCVVGCAVANLAGTVCANIVFFQTPGLYLILMIAVSLLSGAIGGLIAWELLRVLRKYKLIKQPAKRGKKAPAENAAVVAENSSPHSEESLEKTEHKA